MSPAVKCLLVTLLGLALACDATGEAGFGVQPVEPECLSATIGLDPQIDAAVCWADNLGHVWRACCLGPTTP